MLRGIVWHVMMTVSVSWKLRNYSEKDDVFFIMATTDYQLYIDGKEILDVSNDTKVPRSVLVSDETSVMAVHLRSSSSPLESPISDVGDHYFKVWSMNGYFITDERWKCWDTFPGLAWFAIRFVTNIRPLESISWDNNYLPLKICNSSEEVAGSCIGAMAKNTFCRMDYHSHTVNEFGNLDSNETVVIGSNRNFYSFYELDDQRHHLPNVSDDERYRVIKIPRGSERIVVVMDATSTHDNKLKSYYGIIVWSRTGIFDSDERWRCSLGEFEPATSYWSRNTRTYVPENLGSNHDNVLNITLPLIHPQSKWIGLTGRQKQSIVICKLDLVPIARNRSTKIHKEERFTYISQHFQLPREENFNETTKYGLLGLCLACSFALIVTVKIAVTQPTQSKPFERK